MKKLILSLTALCMLTFTAHAGLWSVATGPSKTIKPQAAYTVETPGFNPRVYEWTTTNGNKCLVVMASSNENSSPAVFCFKK